MFNWSADFIGVPWTAHGRDLAGLDCWGLVRFVYWKQLGIILESYSDGYITATERDEISALIGGARAHAPWQEIPIGSEREFDVAIFRCAGLASHVGVVIEPGMMLHVQSGKESEIDRYNDGRWRPRLIGFQRHERVAEGQNVG